MRTTDTRYEAELFDDTPTIPVAAMTPEEQDEAEQRMLELVSRLGKRETI